ncbi:MAG: zf-HC2 domain-containing protein, partial [candidate division WOR-3 bacterium]
MKNTCREVRDLLGPYLDAELAEAERLRVEEHLKACPGCREELAELKALHGLALKAAHPVPTQEHLEQLRRQVSRRLRREARPEGVRSRASPLSFFRLATLGGALVVVMVVVIAGYRLLGDKSARPGPLAEVGIERRQAPAVPAEAAPLPPDLASAPQSEETPVQPAAARSHSEVRYRIAGRMLESEQIRPYESVAEAATGDLAEPQ